MSSTDGVPDADAALVAGEEPPSARVPLDRDRIVAAAVEFIETDGLASLTMRRLGERLGVEAMSLYRYVPGKEDLLDAVVESLVMQMDWDGEVLASPRDGWRWSTRRRFRWWPPGHRRPPGSGPRCGASTGSRRSSRR